MKNLKISKQEKINLKERKIMKKLISSVLAFALTGVPVVSGAFADKNNEKNVETIISLTEKANENEEKQTASKLESILQILLEQNGKLSPSQRQKCVNELLDLIDETNKTGNKQMSETLQVILNGILNENEEQEAKKSDIESKPKEESKEPKNENLKDKGQKQVDAKSKMSIAKIVLFSALIISLIAVGGYLTYTQVIPLFQNHIDKFLTFSKDNIITPITTKAGNIYTKASPYVDKAIDFSKNYVVDPIKSAGGKISNYFNTEGTWGNAIYQNLIVNSITDAISNLFGSKDKK